MKLTEYLKDKVLLLLLHMVCMAGLVIFLRLTGYSMDKCVIILVCYCVILAGWLFLQFFSRRSYFRKLEQLTDQLDRRYLLGELMPESFGLEDQKYRELIRKSNKSVIERIHQMEQNQKDYREYIESWVHEIKAPITAIALNCENNRDERSRYLLVENRKVENYVDMAVLCAHGCGIQRLHDRGNQSAGSGTTGAFAEQILSDPEPCKGGSCLPRYGIQR